VATTLAVVGGLLGDYLTGGAGNDAFVFHLETLTNGLTVTTELGKSTNPDLKQDFITDFTPGQDTIFIQNDNGDNDYAIAYYNSVTADATFINAGAGDVQVVVRRGDYNLTTGTFTQFGVGSGAGADYQVLFMTDGDNFRGTVGARLFAPGAFAGGGPTSMPPRTRSRCWVWPPQGAACRPRTSCSTADPSALKQGELGVPGLLASHPKGRLVRPFLLRLEWVLINVCNPWTGNTAISPTTATPLAITARWRRATSPGLPCCRVWSSPPATSGTSIWVAGKAWG
jgi:hypothetical protein